MTNVNTNAATAKRVTIKSALLAGDVASLSRLLLTQAELDTAAAISKANEAHKDDEAALTLALKPLTVNNAAKALGKTFADAIKAIPETLKALAAEAEAKAKAEAEAAAAALAESEKKAKEREEFFVQMHKETVESMVALGRSVEVATKIADMAVQTERMKDGGSTKQQSNRVRVTVVYKGTEYEMPATGNMAQSLKDMVNETGLTRESFIEQYKKVEQVEEQAAE